MEHREKEKEAEAQRIAEAANGYAAATQPSWRDTVYVRLGLLRDLMPDAEVEAIQRFVKLPDSVDEAKVALKEQV